MKKYIILSLFCFSLFAQIEHAAGGRHIIADFFECESCQYSSDIEQAIGDAVQAAGATILHVYIHKFPPYDGLTGMTGMVVLSESHIAFHTWPEHGYVACDVFTCGSTALPEKAVEVLMDFFKPKYSKIMEISRGDNS